MWVQRISEELKSFPGCVEKSLCSLWLRFFHCFHKDKKWAINTLAYLKDQSNNTSHKTDTHKMNRCFKHNFKWTAWWKFSMKKVERKKNFSDVRRHPLPCHAWTGKNPKIEFLSSYNFYRPQKLMPNVTESVEDIRPILISFPSISISESPPPNKNLKRP